MDILKKTDLEALIETSGDTCISLYMPTHRYGRGQQQDPIRFKNLITRAQDELLASGLRMPEVQGMMRPAENLLVDKVFWQHQSDGLAVFLSPDSFQSYRLPSRFDDLLVIANSFQIKPLLPLISNNEKFYILALSLNEVRLFLGNRYTIDEIDLGDLPTNMREALWMDDPEKHSDFHTRTGSMDSQGERQAIFHGHGAKQAEEKTNILRYFQRIDRGLNDLLDEKTIPILLAGVEYLLPIYRQANTYPTLLEENLKGNPEEMSGEDLYKRAWGLVQPIFKEEQKQELKQFEQLHGQGSELASNDLKTVVKAALFGRVNTLFVPLGVQKWGRYDSKQNKVILDKISKRENEDLLDFATKHTLFNAGKVYAIKPEKLPGNGELAAILRYAV